MHILNLSTDKKIFDIESSVAKRMRLIGSRISGAYSIIVFTKKHEGFKTIKIAENTFVYPTSSRSVWGFKKDALKISKNLQKEGRLQKGQSLVTAQNPFEVGMIGLKIAGCLTLPLEVQVHTDFLNPYYRRMSWRHKVHSMLARKVISKSQSVRVVSDILREELVSKFDLKDRLTVLPVLTEVSFSQKLDKKDGKRILVVSRLEPEKNVAAAIRIFSKVVKKHPEATLSIAGSGSEGVHLKKLVKELGLEATVSFLGFVPNIGDILDNTDLLLHTSFFEGYGLVFIEAGARGVPIISFDVGIVSMFKQNGGAFVSPVGDEDGLSSGLEKALSDNALRDTMKVSARKTAEVLMWQPQKYLNKLVGDWQNIIKHSRI